MGFRGRGGGTRTATARGRRLRDQHRRHRHHYRCRRRRHLHRWYRNGCRNHRRSYFRRKRIGLAELDPTPAGGAAPPTSPVLARDALAPPTGGPPAPLPPRSRSPSSHTRSRSPPPRPLPLYLPLLLLVPSALPPLQALTPLTRLPSPPLPPPPLYSLPADAMAHVTGAAAAAVDMGAGVGCVSPKRTRSVIQVRCALCPDCGRARGGQRLCNLGQSPCEM